MCAHKYAHPAADMIAAVDVPLFRDLQMNASMPDPRSITTKPAQSLLRARTFKCNPSCSFILEVTGKGKLSSADHQEVKWVPHAPDNAIWADTVKYDWMPKETSGGAFTLVPVLVQHNYVGKYADQDPIVSSCYDINKSYMSAVRLLTAAGHKVRRPGT